MTLNISSVWDLLSYIFECSRSFFRQSQVLQQQNSVGKTVWRVFPLKSEQGQESLVSWGCQTSFDHLKIGQYIFKKHHRTIGLILWFSWNHRCFSKIKETCKNYLLFLSKSMAKLLMSVLRELTKYLQNQAIKLVEIHGIHLGLKRGCPHMNAIWKAEFCDLRPLLSIFLTSHTIPSHLFI